MVRATLAEAARVAWTHLTAGSWTTPPTGPSIAAELACRTPWLRSLPVNTTPMIARDKVAAEPAPVDGGPPTTRAHLLGAPADVVHAAWIAAGRPRSRPAHGVGAPAVDRCARCDEAGSLAAVRQIVSRSFTARDGWLHPAGPGLCSACSWAYREPPLRRLPHIVQQTPLTLTALTPATLSQALSEEVNTQAAITIPASGRKHLLPGARWGLVLLDDIALPWNDADATHLALIHELRALGASDDDLRQPAPPWPLLRTAGPDRGHLLATWDRLRRWREQRPAHLDIALIATRHVREPARDLNLV